MKHDHNHKSKCTHDHNNTNDNDHRHATQHDDDEAIRDAAAADGTTEADWIGMKRHKCNDHRHTTTTIITTTHGSSHPTWMQLNCMTLPPSCTSPESSSIGVGSHPKANATGIRLAESSSGLLAAIDPTYERVKPHEWPLYGEDGREVMSPAQESPTAKLAGPAGGVGGLTRGSPHSQGSTGGSEYRHVSVCQ